ncbi:hypothetical protein LCGC14_2304210 [marine sediment metagenome]|uniref:Uncharacterized protein n=1 Tax=marine sediment metagenome TaxID=412755 RepID=A0A0F9DA11_9ZZZZ
MASDIVLTNVVGQVQRLTAKADEIWRRGTIIGYDSGWVRADADAAANIYGQLISLTAADGNDPGDNQFVACRACDIFDVDAPFTAATAQYLSGTAGGFTETRPTTDGDLIQVVGWSYDDSHAFLKMNAPIEYEIFLSPDPLDTTGEPGLGSADTGWPGPQVDATGESFYFKGRFPSGLVGAIAEARVIFNSINASAFDNDVSIVGGYDGASNVQDTGAPITAGDWNVDTNDLLLYQDISSLIDADFYKPGRNFAVFCDPDGITNDATVIGLSIRGWRLP